MLLNDLLCPWMMHLNLDWGTNNGCPSMIFLRTGTVSCFEQVPFLDTWPRNSCKAMGNCCGDMSFRFGHNYPKKNVVHSYCSHELHTLDDLPSPLPSFSGEWRRLWDSYWKHGQSWELSRQPESLSLYVNIASSMWTNSTKSNTLVMQTVLWLTWVLKLYISVICGSCGWNAFAAVPLSLDTEFLNIDEGPVHETRQPG